MTNRLFSYRLRDSKQSSKSEKKRKTGWRSIYLSCGIIGIAALNMTLYATSLWPYIQFLTGRSNVEWLGWAMASTSLGSILADPLLGWWQEKINSKQPLICGFIVTFFGNFLYALAPIFPRGMDLYVLVFSRICLGFASSAIGILRTFVTMNSLEEDRLEGGALLSIGLTLGLSLGPVVQMLYLFIGEEQKIFDVIVFNEYTVPAFVMSFLCLIIIMVILLFFEENLSGVIDEDPNNNASSSSPISPSHSSLPPFDRLGLAVLFYIWCLMMTAASSEYSISGPLTRAMYGWDAGEFIEKHGFIQSAQCILSAIAAIVLIKTRVKRLDNRLQMVIALSLLITASLTLFPWPFYQRLSHDHNGRLVENGNENGTTKVDSDPDVETSVTRKVPLTLYIIALAFCYGPGASIGLSVTNTLASLIIGPRKQGIIQGWMTAAGSLCSFLWPLATSYLFKWTGMKWITVLNAVFYLIAFFLIWFCRKRLIPLRVM